MMYYREFNNAGYRIFPINGVDGDGKCMCGNPSCPALYKHPRNSLWQHTPLWSEEQLECQEDTNQLDTGYGVLCRGLLVIDVDARNGGIESYQRLFEQIPEIDDAGLKVATGSGGGSKHLYFAVPEGLALVQHLKDFPGIDFKSSGFVVGPGSMHISGNKYTIYEGNVDDIDEPPAALIDLLKKPERHRSEYNGGHIDVSLADLADMLSHVDPDCDHETWIRCGMSVHEASQGTGFEVWDEWSGKGSKYPGIETMQHRWASFGKSGNPVTVGTLIYYAEQGGWVVPVTFEADELFAETRQEEPKEDGLPFSLDGVDLNSPPGKVGDVKRWIDAQCRRPRERLATAAALFAVANAGGLKYTDDLNGVTSNLFMFCVAGSRTGKEGVLQAVSEIHSVAGISPAEHGSIKSEQEIVRNAVEHQSVLYLIDEIGFLLDKIKSSQGAGGAHYLQGVIGALMAIYSKSEGRYQLTGDMKREIKAKLLQQIGALMKQADSADSIQDEERLTREAESLKATLGEIDMGLKKPFLSLMGFTTPVTFDHLVDYNGATNGFIGRSLIFSEVDTAPKSKKRFKKKPMPEEMQRMLMGIASTGVFDQRGGRIEYTGDRAQIPTSAPAADMLDACVDWFEDFAEAQKSATGLEALALGAYELVSKISLVLAIPGGLRTEEHVRWAFALVKRDIEFKMHLVTANDRVKDNPAVALRSRIMSLIGDDDGMTFGTMKHRIRGTKPDDIKKMLDALVAEGHVELVEGEHPKTKKKFERYRVKG